MRPNVVNRLNEDPYPYKGYIFEKDGTHDGGEWLKNQQELYAFMNRMIEPIINGHEVMICDNLDYCSFHAKHGEIIFPNDERLRKEIFG